MSYTKMALESTDPSFQCSTKIEMTASDIMLSAEWDMTYERLRDEEEARSVRGVDQERSTARTDTPASDQIAYDEEHLREAQREWSEEAKWRERLADAICRFAIYQPLIHSLSSRARKEGHISETEMARLQRSAARLERVLSRSDEADMRGSVEECLCHLPKCAWHPSQRHISDAQVRSIVKYCETGEVDDRPRFESALERLRETLPREMNSAPASVVLAVDLSWSTPKKDAL